jgi:T5SS/PEP-CTERM-associated repeat protein
MNVIAVRVCVWLALGSLAVPTLMEAQVTWNAGTGNWFTNTNWTPNIVPTSAIDASINNAGTAQVLATGGAVRVLTLGAGVGQSGTLQVNGGALTTSSSLLVGDFGSGTITVSNGGVLASPVTGIANNLGSTGVLTVTGLNSRWNLNGTFDVGSSGNGTLNVTEGGTVAAAGRIMNVGNDNTAVGLVVITGNTLATSLTAGASFIGNAVGSSGQVQVHGALASYAEV